MHFYDESHPFPFTSENIKRARIKASKCANSLNQILETPEEVAYLSRESLEECIDLCTEIIKSLGTLIMHVSNCDKEGCYDPTYCDKSRK